MNASHQRYREYLENLSAGLLVELATSVTEDVHLKNPFDDVRGVAAMRRVFQHMFANIGDLRFAVLEIVSEGAVCLIAWRFEGKLSVKPWAFEGASVIHFANDGRVAVHREHWDATQVFTNDFLLPDGCSTLFVVVYRLIERHDRAFSFLMRLLKE